MEQITLDLIPNGVMPNIHASQFDHGRTIRFNLCEGKTPFSLLATDYVKVACNNIESVSSANVGNSHDWTIPDAVVSDSGVFLGELSVERGSKVIGSKNFILKVEADAYDGIEIEEKTASGAIASFETNLQDVLTECVCTINPVQDLHGYTKPWSGGAGKNKLNYDAWKTTGVVNGTAVFENNGVTLTATSNDCYTSAPNGFPVSARIPITEGETITLSWQETTNQSGQVYIFPNGTTTGMVYVNNNTYKKVSYTATSGITYITFRFGVNTSGQTISYKNIQIEKGSTATAWEPFENICPISGFNGATISVADENMQVQQTYAISFGQEVYGGVLDVTNGKLTITHKGQTFTSVVNGGASSTASWWGQLLSSGAKPTNNNIKADVKANYLETVTASNVINTENDCIGVNTNGAINIKIQGITSIADYNTYLANNPVTVVYELATQTEITLTAKEIDTLLHDNNIYSDTGDILSMKYIIAGSEDVFKYIRMIKG